MLYLPTKSKSSKPVKPNASAEIFNAKAHAKELASPPGPPGELSISDYIRPHMQISSISDSRVYESLWILRPAHGKVDSNAVRWTDTLGVIHRYNKTTALKCGGQRVR